MDYELTLNLTVPTSPNGAEHLLKYLTDARTFGVLLEGLDKGRLVEVTTTKGPVFINPALVVSIRKV